MITIAIVAVVLVALYLYGTQKYDYWKKRGVTYEKPIPYCGTYAKIYMMRRSWGEVAADTYFKYPKEKIVGTFQGSSRPELIVRDPEISKLILTTDFLHFHPRGLNPHVGVEPLMKNLFFADGDLWKLLRQRITPAFSTGKLKAMFPLIVERAERLQERVQGAAKDNASIMDARDVMARYTTDFIGSVGFGIDTDSLTDENSKFRKLGYDIFNVTLVDFLKIMAKELFPTIFQKVHTLAKVEDDLMNLVEEIQKQRNYQPSGRNDFIDLLLDLKNKGTIIGESIEKVKPDGTPDVATLELDSELLAAQVFVFFAAGFETSSSATSYTLHQLAYNPEVQKKVQRDIDRVLAKHDNKLSYDAVKEMTYLEWTFKEGMRKFPSLGFLIRKCSRKYTIPIVDVPIDEGVSIIIPLQAMHNDPQYFDNPEEFRPERFDPDNFDPNNKFVYMPFGEGPRACIGTRLGLMQSIAGLAAILSKFTVEPAPETKRYPEVDPTSGVTQSIKGGIPLKFRKRIDKQ